MLKMVLSYDVMAQLPCKELMCQRAGHPKGRLKLSEAIRTVCAVYLATNLPVPYLFCTPRGIHHDSELGGNMIPQNLAPDVLIAKPTAGELRDRTLA